MVLVGLAGCGSGGSDAVKESPTTSSPRSSAPAGSRPAKTVPSSTSRPSPTSTSTSIPSTEPPVSTTVPAAPPTTIPVTPALWCTPHTPIAHVANSYFGLPAPSGPSIDYPPQVVPAHDDHGNTIQQVGLSVEMTGPGGTITLTHGGPTNDVVLARMGRFQWRRPH